MSRAKLTGEELAAQVKRLKGRFPALKKLSRRKKNFSQGERQSIYFAMRAADIMTQYNVRERAELVEEGKIPAYFINYKFPRDRRMSDNRAKQIARELLPFATPETKETLKKIIRTKKLSPAQRGIITKKKKAMPFAEGLIPLDKKTAEQLPPLAVRGRGRRRGETTEKPGQGVYGIKLRGHDPKEIKKFRVENKIISFEELERGPNAKTREYLYVPVDFDLREGEDAFMAKFNAAAKKYFDMGAHSVQIWTVNGAAGDAYGSYNLFKRQVGERYFSYLLADEGELEEIDEEEIDEEIDEEEYEEYEETVAKTKKDPWILGIVVLFRR